MTNEPVGPEEEDFQTRKTVKTASVPKIADDSRSHRAYWHKNILYLCVLLSIWFVVSFGCGIIFSNELDQCAPMGGFKLGFWFGQQGSIYTFVILIWVYVYLMNRLDKKFDVDEGEDN
jgi:putative solute:sodium symporter small subunit